MRRLALARLHCDGTALQFGLGDDFLPDGVFGLPASGRRFQTKRRDPAQAIGLFGKSDRAAPRSRERWFWALRSLRGALPRQATSVAAEQKGGSHGLADSSGTPSWRNTDQDD